MRNRLFIIIYIFFYLFQIQAQTNNLDSLLDEILFEEEDLSLYLNPNNNFHFFYGRTNYDNKTFYAGREIGTDQYNLSGQLYYFNSKGFYIGTGGAWYSQIDPNYSATILSVGYSKGLKTNNNIRYRASYNRYFYNNNDPDYEPTYKSSANLGTTFKKKWLGTRFDISFLMGNEFGTNASLDMYSKINLLKFGTYNKIRLEPEISFYFGAETIEYNTYNYFTSFFPEDQLSYYTEKKFGLMNTQLIVPISIFYKNFDFELGYILNIPRSLDKNYYYEKKSYINISLGYILSFTK